MYLTYLLNHTSNCAKASSIAADDPSASIAMFEPLGLRRAVGEFDPDCVFYLAGADPFVDDRLGLLSLMKAGLRARDAGVLDFFGERDVPVAIAMVGGYADEIEDIVDIHFGTVQVALQRLRNS